VEDGRPRPARGTRRRRHRHPSWLWVLLLALAVAGIPAAAFGEGDMGGSASAADPLPARVVDDGPFGAELPWEVTVRVARSERSGPILALDDASVAHGTPNGGSLSGAVRLPVRGEGFYTYDPATQRPPQSPERRWGTTALVDQILDLGRWWHARHPRGARLGVGDLSRRSGGPFTGPVVGHSSHQNGLDVDIRLPRRDGVEGPATAATYDRALTQQVVDRLVAQGASLVLIGPSLDLTGPAGVVVRWPNHDDHLHVRFPDPDGAGN
jgi:hypothetical protein